MKRPLLRWPILGLLTALLVGCGLLHLAAAYGVHHPAGERTVSWKSLSEIPVRRIDGIEYEWDESVLQATSPENGLAIERFPLPSVSHLTLHIEPLAPFDYQQFVMFYWGADTPPDETWALANSFDVMRGTALRDGDHWKVIWHFPRPIVAGWFRLPRNAAFRLQGIDITAEPFLWENGTVNYLPMLVKWLLFAVVATLILLIVQRWPAQWTLDAILVKKVLILGLVPAYASVIFLLPPFQGPDEYIHWKHALERCRPDPFGEICLHNLYEISGAHQLPFNTENRLAAQFLRSDPGDRQPDVEKEKKVTYATWFSHPFVWITGLWFPRVETVREALFFYYLCRTLPAILLLSILWLANRKGLVPYTALVFFSFPLVIEQFTVVSSDTVPNMGSLVAALLFQSAWRRPAGWKVAALWLIVTVIVLAKPPLYISFYSLPIFVTPWRAIPRKRIWVPAVLLTIPALVVGSYFAWQYGLRLMHGGEEPTALAKTINFLQTPHGWHHFERLCHQVLRARITHWPGWYEPLGWLDTGLSDYHHVLIAAAFFLALGFDAIYYGRGFLAWLAAHAHWEHALQRGWRKDQVESHPASMLRAWLVLGPTAAGYLIGILAGCVVGLVLNDDPFGRMPNGIPYLYLLLLGVLFLFAPFVTLAGLKRLWRREWTVDVERYYRQITSTNWTTASVIGLVVGNLLFIGVITCLIMYILYTEPWGQIIYGVQVRYFFPVGILAMFLPLCLVSAPPEKQPLAPRFGWIRSLAATLALSLFAALWLARQVELTIDLLCRYWS